ncbi:MAG: DUF2244 domain-containing protein [Polymorphobacter sp.]
MHPARYQDDMARALDLTLTPNRSLDRRHCAWLLAGVGVIFALGGLRLLLLGAWPVLPFMVIDLALLAWAFRASYRSGRAYERVWVERGVLTVCKVNQHGVARPLQFDPARTRASLEPLAADQNRLWLTSGARRCTIGSFLSADERVALHPLLVAGLANRQHR